MNGANPSPAAAADIAASAAGDRAMSRKYVRVTVPALDPKTGLQPTLGARVTLPDGAQIPGVQKVTFRMEAGNICRARIECVATIEVADGKIPAAPFVPTNLAESVSDRLTKLLTERDSLDDLARARNVATLLSQVMEIAELRGERDAKVDEIADAIRKLGESLGEKIGAVLKAGHPRNGRGYQP